jgi:hypothetical protein
MTDSKTDNIKAAASIGPVSHQTMACGGGMSRCRNAAFSSGWSATTWRETT